MKLLSETKLFILIQVQNIIIVTLNENIMYGLKIKKKSLNFQTSIVFHSEEVYGNLMFSVWCYLNNYL